jgi:BMFP domain-containing protein YqiC
MNRSKTLDADVNLSLITRAEANGQTRLAASLRQVQDNLERIIPALEAIPAGEEPDDDQN